MTARQIFKGRGRAEREVENLLQTIFAAELVSPSECLWLVSPWITDVVVIDNRGSGFSGLEPTWARRGITLVEVLAVLLERGTGVIVATRPDDHNDRFLGRLDSAARGAGVSQRLRTISTDQASLHEKGLVGDDYYVSGSMNFTENGIRLHDEALKFDLDPEAVALARVNFRERYGVPAG